MEIDLDKNELNDFYNQIKETQLIGLVDVIFVYKTHKVPCSIKIDGKNLEININSTLTSQSGIKFPCLDLLIIPGEKAYIGYIEAGEHCIMEKMPQMGTFIHDFAVKLCEQLNVKIIQLTDKSTIKCNGKDVSLSFLSAITKGRTWYQSKGYETSNPNFNIFINQIRNFNIDEISIEVNKIKSPLVELWNQEVHKFKEVNKENPHILSNFVNYIWNKDCNIYVKLYPLLIQLIPEIPKIGLLTKTLFGKKRGTLKRVHDKRVNHDIIYLNSL